MAAIDIRERLRLLGSALPTLDFLVADLSNQSLPDLVYYEGQGRLQRAWGDPELVVLDNLSSLAGFKSGDPDCWTELQRFLMLQRGRSRAVLVVHHSNKQGGQRGTNRREDVLDLVMALRQPRDYQPKDGAHFEIHFEKARGLSGEAVDPIEARLETDHLGVSRWSWRAVHLSQLERIAALLREGLKPNQVARELGMAQSYCYRLSKRARGRLGAMNSAPGATKCPCSGVYAAQERSARHDLSRALTRDHRPSLPSRGIRTQGRRAPPSLGSRHSFRFLNEDEVRIEAFCGCSRRSTSPSCCAKSQASGRRVVLERAGRSLSRRI